MTKLNLGCGQNKINGCINVDIEKSCNPDLVHDFLKTKLPFESGSMDEVYLFHTIEHIQKKFHRFLISEIHRVLKPNGKFMVSYPEFLKCVERWKNNTDDLRGFWEMTIFGRQLYPSDHHVCIMDSTEFMQILIELGFRDIKCCPEPIEVYNTIIECKKGIPFNSYEEMLSADLDRTTIVEFKQ